MFKYSDDRFMFVPPLLSLSVNIEVPVNAFIWTTVI